MHKRKHIDKLAFLFLLSHALAETWRRLWGRTEIFEWPFLGKKIPFHRQKILTTFFRLYFVLNLIYNIYHTGSRAKWYGV